MTKPRPSQTEFAAASYAVAVLSEDDIKGATLKGVSSRRRASDPDDTAVRVAFRDAAMLEAVLIAQGHEPKFGPAFNNIVEQALGRSVDHTPAEAEERLVELMSRLGHVVDEIRASRCPNGPGGVKRLPHEIESCLSQAHELRATVDKLIADLEADEGNVHNLNSKKEAS